MIKLYSPKISRDQWPWNIEYRPVTIVEDKEESNGDLVLPGTGGILSPTSSSSSNVSSMFLILFSFFCRKNTLNHTRARQRPMSPRQLSPVASTRRHVAQVEKKKDRKREAKSHSRTRPCVDPTYVYINVLVSFPGTTQRDTFDVDARRSTRMWIGMRFYKLISWDYLRWSACSGLYLWERHEQALRNVIIKIYTFCASHIFIYLFWLLFIKYDAWILIKISVIKQAIYSCIFHTLIFSRWLIRLT